MGVCELRRVQGLHHLGALQRARPPCSYTRCLPLAPQAGNGLIELRRIEAARDIAGTLSKSRNVVYLPSGGPNMLLGINPSQ